VVVEDLGVMGGDETHPAHVRGERIDLIDVTGRRSAILPAAKIQAQEFVAVRGTEFRFLDVRAAHPAAVAFETAGQMTPDESTCSGNKNFCRHSVAKFDFKLTSRELRFYPAAPSAPVMRPLNVSGAGQRQPASRESGSSRRAHGRETGGRQPDHAATT